MVPGTILRQALTKLRDLGLWPRLVVAVTLGFVLLFGIFSLLSLRAVNDSTRRILQERLVIAQMAAQEEDRLLERGFYELERATEFAAFDPERPSLDEEHHILAHTFGRIGALSLGVLFLDAQGRVVLAEPRKKLPLGTDLSMEAHIREVRETRSRSVSDPFVDLATGKPAVALTIPILRSDGTLVAMLSGLIDVSSDEVLSPLRQARDLGHTGHAELVDRTGHIIATTEHGGFLQPGEHLPFYLQMLPEGRAGVESVPYSPWHAPASAERAERHVMAFAPVSGGPWGVAVGGADWETFAPVTRLRNTILLAGALSLAFLWAMTLVAARLLVRPVRDLTQAARRMASGKLEQPISVGWGGEISVLAESLETMRERLRASLERLQRWGEDLEAKVAERTEQLTARNRQLAAVAAVATAANEIRDQEGMLKRCLEVVLQYSEMETASIRLMDGSSQQLAVASAQGDFSGFPCRDHTVRLGECPCGYVATSGMPLYLRPEEREQFQPQCRVSGTLALAVVPLKSPKSVIGVLAVSRSLGGAPDTQEQEMLEAICNQIAVAIENARLLSELGRMEVQQELERVKGEFIAAISHELRTPLGFIKGYATTLLREDIAVDPGTRKEFLAVIDEESSKLQQMIDELLDASRLKAGRLRMERTPVDLRAVLDAVIHRATDGLQQAGHPLTFRGPSGPLPMVADSARLEQVLHNLLDNASRYSNAGSPIDVETVLQGQEVLVRVRDHGDGIPGSEQERIFEPFYRGENSRRRGARGTGLGLAICKSIIDAHGGRLWVESEPGRGSTFCFALPVATPQRLDSGTRR